MSPTNQFSTRYLNNYNDSNLVIDLMFLRQDSLELNNHMIYSDWRLSLDHTFLTVNIIIIEEYVQTKRHTLVKNSEEEEKFIEELINAIAKLNTNNISDKEMLELIIQILTTEIDRLWLKLFKVVNITKHSKTWWNNDCHGDLEKYRVSKQLED